MYIYVYIYIPLNPPSSIPIRSIPQFTIPFNPEESQWSRWDFIRP